jgi:uracil-DNA glycosylase
MLVALNPPPFVNRSEDFLKPRRCISLGEYSSKLFMNNNLHASSHRGFVGVAMGTGSALGGAEPM